MCVHPGGLRLHPKVPHSCITTTVVSGCVSKWLRSVIAIGSNDAGAVPNGRSLNDKRKEVSAYRFDITVVPLGFEPAECYSESAGPVSKLGADDTSRPNTDTNASEGDKLNNEPRHWKLADLAVQCTEGLCQVNLGPVPIMVIEPKCDDTDGMKCTLLVPSRLGWSRRTAFLDEAVSRFRVQMDKQSAHRKWGHSQESEQKLAAAMQQA